MNIKRISRDRMLEKLSLPYNPPATVGRLLSADFRDEWWNVRRGLIQRLQKFGEHDLYGKGDFGIGEDITASRGIGIDMNSAKMLEPAVLTTIQDYLNSLKPDYEVYFSFSVDEEMADVFVQREMIFVHCPDEALSTLGWIGDSSSN